MAVPAPGTAASVQFLNINQNDLVVNANFSIQDGFRRAIKVFVMSYPELSNNSPAVYKQKFDEFLLQMANLYGIPVQPNILAFLGGLYTAVGRESYQIVISAKRIRGRNQLRRGRFLIRMSTGTVERLLDLRQEVQPYVPLRIGTSYASFAGHRGNPVANNIVMSIAGDDWVQINQPLNEFDFIIANTNPEGFEEWIDFGRGVQLLICVEYKVLNERNVTQEDVSEFHFHTILMMIERRLRAFRQSKADKFVSKDIGHKETAFRSKVTYRRPVINPQTNDMFWSAPTRNRPSAVKYNDMQIGYMTNENFEDSICLCSEWCNWNAFFYYNPIYRFLMVRHRQLFMSNPTSIPDMYLCLSILSACFNTPVPNKTPVLLLMKSANDYMNRYYDNYYLKNNFFVTQYNSVFPTRDILNGLTYNRIKTDMNITKLVHEMDVNPFSDECIEALKGYFKVLTDLHVYHSRIIHHVTDKKAWFREMDALNRHHYHNYFKASYDLCVANFLGGYDYLFTTDYQYADRAKTDLEFYAKTIRDNVTKKVQTDNPFNFKVISSDFLNTFAMIYKFLVKVEPYLPTVRKTHGLTELIDCYIQFDEDFALYDAQQKHMIFQFDVNSTGYPNLERHFTIFYTLKVYSYLFEIQKHCIKPLLRLNRIKLSPKHLVSDDFVFIWENSDIIERKYRTVFPGEVLFEVSPDLAIAFEDFYITYWGRARHETTIPLPSILEVIDSGHFQYQRLYYWQKNKGNEKRKFQRILNLFNASILDVINRSEDIFNRWIIPAIKQLSPNYSYDLEVFDYLVYYLVKANCSMILSTTTNLFIQMDTIRDKTLSRSHISYSLCKPGWVLLIRTFHEVLDEIDRIRTNYMVFEDEFNRISNACNETEIIIKNIYRQFYSKLSSEWINELYKVYNGVTVVNQNAKEFICIHLAVGLAFVSTFFEDFPRDYFSWIRSCIYLLHPRTLNPNLTHQVAFTIAIPVVLNYLNDITLVEEAKPFQAGVWRSFFTNTFGRFDRLTSSQVNIDMSAANH